jgi:hypothetical protein
MADAPAAPAGLRGDGLKLWRDVTETYALECHELAILRVAAAAADVVGRLSAELSAAPALTDAAVRPTLRELRSQSALLAQLMEKLHLPVSLETAMQRVNVRGDSRELYEIPS